MQTNGKLFTIACRVAVFTFLVAGSAMLMQAQQTPSVAPAVKAPVFLAALAAPDYAASYFGNSSSSSSSSSDALAAEDSLDSFGSSASEGLQPPPRRRYGQPSYSGGNTNPDGSSKWTFLAGGGLNLPVGGTHSYATPSWRFQVGGGRNFSKITGVMLQFDWDHFGMQTKTLNNEANLYQTSQVNGSIHDWSFSLDPTFTVPTQGSLGAYAVVGVGFYHKYTQFTVPSSGLCYDYYYGYYQCTANEPIDWYTSNAFGVNAGVGITWKFSKFSNQKFYIEGRYVYTANQRKPYDISGKTSYFNDFPQGSAPTTYIPITFGLRF